MKLVLTEEEAGALADLRAMRDIIAEHFADYILPAGIPETLGPHGIEVVADYARLTAKLVAVEIEVGAPTQALTTTRDSE